MQMLGGREGSTGGSESGFSNAPVAARENKSNKDNVEELSIDDIEVDEFDADEMPF